MLAKLSRGNQLTLPKKVVEQARLKAGQDYVEVGYEKGVIYLKPIDVEERISPETYERLLAKSFDKEEGDVLVREHEAGRVLARRKNTKKRPR